MIWTLRIENMLDHCKDMEETEQEEEEKEIEERNEGRVEENVVKR